MAYALLINGGSEYIELSAPVVVEEYTPFTLEFAVSCGSEENYAIIFGTKDAYEGRLHISDTELTYKGANSLQVFSLVGYTPSEYTRFTLTRDASNTLHVYMGGVLQDSKYNGESLSFDLIGTFFGPSVNRSSVALQYLSLDDTLYLSSVDSAHGVGAVALSDTVGAVTGVGVGMPSDGSSWIDLGSGGVNLVPSASDVSFNVFKTATVGSVVGSVVGSDTDGTIVSYTITGSTFGIDDSGEITVLDSSGLVVGTVNETVSITDEDGGVGAATVTFNISDGALNVILSVSETRLGESFSIVTNGSVDLTGATVTATYAGTALTGQANTVEDSVDFTMPDGLFELGVEHDVVLTVDGVATDAFTAEALPPTGYSFVTLTSIDEDSWLADAVYSGNPGTDADNVSIGDQIVYQNTTQEQGTAAEVDEVGITSIPNATADGVTGNQTITWFYLEAQEGYANSNESSLVLVAPVETVSLTISATPSTLAVGEVSTLSFVFSGAVTGFSPANITVDNGSLSAFSGSGDTYTATFTPVEEFSGTSVVTVESTADYSGDIRNIVVNTLPTPQAPQGAVTLSTTIATTSAAAISYSYSGSDATGFEYRFGGVVSTPDEANSRVSLEGLDPGTSYNVEVRAVNATGPGAWYSHNFSTTQATLSISVGNVTATSADVSIVYTLSDAIGFEYTLGDAVLSAGAGNSFTITDLTPETAYALEVRAVISSGVRQWTDPTNFTTLASSVVVPTTSTFSLSNTGTPDGTYTTKFYDDVLNSFIAEKSLSFVGGSATTTLEVPAGNAVHSLTLGSNPPTTGMAYVGVTT